MLQKKEIIQKSFRMDAKVDEALSKLAKILNCSQNDLVEIAVKKLIKDNELWFLENFTKEYREKIEKKRKECFCEEIYDYRISYIPYDYEKKEEGVLRLSLDTDEYHGVISEYKISNHPSSINVIHKALGEIFIAISIRHPEILDKYGINLPNLE